MAASGTFKISDDVRDVLARSTITATTVKLPVLRFEGLPDIYVPDADAHALAKTVLSGGDSEMREAAADARIMSGNLIAARGYGPQVMQAALASAATLLDRLAGILEPVREDRTREMCGAYA